MIGSTWIGNCRCGSPDLICFSFHDRGDRYSEQSAAATDAEQPLRSPPQVLLRAGLVYQEGREGDRQGREEKTEGRATEEEREEAEEEDQAREGMFDRKDELLRARQRPLAHRSLMERRAILFLYERQQQHLLVHPYH